MANKKLDSSALGYSGAIISSAGMLLLGLLGNFGLYTGAVEMMSKWHMFFNLSFGGIISGMIEAAIISFIFVYAFGEVYNKLMN